MEIGNVTKRQQWRPKSRKQTKATHGSSTQRDNPATVRRLHNKNVYKFSSKSTSLKRNKKQKYKEHITAHTIGTNTCMLLKQKINISDVNPYNVCENHACFFVKPRKL